MITTRGTYFKLSLTRVNKTFYGHIHGNTRASQAFGLTPRAKQDVKTHIHGGLHIFPSNICLALIMFIRDLQLHYNYLNKVRVGADVTKQVVGSWSEMLLLQPPIKEIGMSVHRPDTQFASIRLSATVVLRCPEYVKLGDLVRSTAKLLETFRWRNQGFVMFSARLDKEGNLYCPLSVKVYEIITPRKKLSIRMKDQSE